MPRGRPKKLSNYEQIKAKKIRSALSAQNITRFDAMHDSRLLNTLYVDSKGRIFVSYDFVNGRLKDLCKLVNEFADK